MPRLHRLSLLALFLLLLVVAAALPPAGATPPAAEPGPQIRLLRAAFDPLREEPSFPAGVRVAAAEPGTWRYALVQFRGPVRPEWTEAAVAAGAELLDYVPDYAFIARLQPGAAEAVAALEGVRWLGPYHPIYRLSPALDAALVGAPPAGAAPLDLRVALFRGEDLSAVEREFAALGARIRERAQTSWGGTLRLELPAGALAAAARLEGVAWLEPVYPRTLQNDVARRTMGVHTAWSRVSNLYGSGQIVAVADTGLDSGNAGTLSTDFAGRLAGAYAWGPSGTWADRDAHGTHVAGSVLGSGALSGSNPATHSYTTGFAGVAPEARLFVQGFDVDTGGELLGIPADLNLLFQRGHTAGARIHTNSWGGPTGEEPNPYGGYDAQARQADQFAWEHKDAAILFAAGNSGVDADASGVVDLDSIGSPGTAKNVITVGASESFRPEDVTFWGYRSSSATTVRYPALPIAIDMRANNTAGLAAFSSRGPTDDGRIKPDLVAPGTDIISARSHHPDAGTGWGVYDANYVYMGGTSMATPLTAGAATLVRQWYTDRQGVANASGALIKATLINGATALAPGQYGSGSAQEVPYVTPNNVAGWGRVNVAGSVAPDSPTRLWFEDHTQGLTTGSQVTYYFTTSAATRPGVLPGEAGRLVLEPAPGGPLPPGWESGVFEALGAPAGEEAAPAAGGAPGAEAAAAAATELVANGGFESGGSNWTISAPAFIATGVAHSGSRSAQLTTGNGQQGWLTQGLVFPSNVVSGTVSFWLKIDSSELALGCDIFTVGLYTKSGSTYSPYLALGALDAYGASGQWMRASLLFDSNIVNAIKGRTLYLLFAGRTDSYLITRFYVDDVSLRYETALPSQRPFRATLAWTDYPGTLGAARALVNDLDLEVIAPDGTHYYGNNATAGARDRTNNVETVWLNLAPAGTWQVIVRGHNVPQASQPYALVVSGSDLRVAQQPPTTPSPTATGTGTPTRTTTPTRTRTPTPGPSPTRTVTRSAPLGAHLPIVLRPAQATATPTSTSQPTGSIYGVVTRGGAPAAGVQVQLQTRFGTGNWSTVATTTTGPGGRYDFYSVPSLAAGQEYAVYYRGPGAGYLYLWRANKITSYPSGAAAAGGDFDIADIPLVSPADGATVSLPARFSWTPRGIAGDNYQLIMFYPDASGLAGSEYLGGASFFDVGGLPAGWPSGASYVWWVRVYQGSNPDATPYNYGDCFGDREARINYSGGGSSLWRLQPIEPLDARRPGPQP